MKRILLCLALVIVFVNMAHAQKVDVVNTTWKVYFYYKESGNKTWESGGTLTFLPNGKIEGDNCDVPSRWKLVGNKLSYENGCGDQMMFTVTIQGNQASGTGEITWHSTPIVVRLEKEVRQGIAPRGQPTGRPGGDGFGAFYANFKRAVLSNDRASVQNMMSPVFLVALGDEESPEQAVHFWGSRQWQQLRVAVNRFPARCKQPCLGNSGYRLDGRQFGELVFAEENGKWKWKGLLND